MPSPNSRRIGEDPFWSGRLRTMKQPHLGPAPPVLQAELAKPEFSKSLTFPEWRELPCPSEVSVEWPLECPPAPRIPSVASFDASDDLPDLSFSSSSSSFDDLRSPTSFSYPDHPAFSDSTARMLEPVVVGLGIDTGAFGGYGLVGLASGAPDTNSGCGDRPSDAFLKELEGHYLDDTTDAHISTFPSSSTIKDLRNFAKSKGEAQASMATAASRSEITTTTASPTSVVSPSRFRVLASARIPIELSYKSPSRMSSWCQFVSSPATSPSLPRRAPSEASFPTSDSNATIKEGNSTVASSTRPASTFSTYSRPSTGHTLDRPHLKGLGRSMSTSGTSFTTRRVTDAPKAKCVEAERGRRLQRPVSVVGVCRDLDWQLTDNNVTKVTSIVTTTSLPRTTSSIPHVNVSHKSQITRPTSSLSINSKRPSFGKGIGVTSNRPMSALGICSTDTLGLSNSYSGSTFTSRSLSKRNRTVSSSYHLSENIGKNIGRRSSIFGVPRDNNHQKLSLGRSNSSSAVRTVKTRTISSSSHLSENVIPVPSSRHSSTSQTSAVSEKGPYLSHVERGRKPQRKSLSLSLTRDLSASTLASTRKQNPSGVDVSLRKKIGNMSGGRSGNGDGASTGPGIGLKRTTTLVHPGDGKVRRGSSAPTTAGTANPVRWR